MTKLLQQCLPLTVLKLEVDVRNAFYFKTVATALTACGIETNISFFSSTGFSSTLQQCLPLAVLKLLVMVNTSYSMKVATALTVYGIVTAQL